MIITEVMVQASPQLISFEHFLAWYPNDGKRYELHQGVVVEMLPTGHHDKVAGFLALELGLHIRQAGLPYFIPRACVVKPQGEQSGYQPDVIVLDQSGLNDEPLWQKYSTVQNSQSVPLVIEVVSTNWSDDYLKKFAGYEQMQILEYWLVDFRALGAVRYLGKPKQPTITVCTLVEGEYWMQPFNAGQVLESRVFPALELSVDAVFESAAVE